MSQQNPSGAGERRPTRESGPFGNVHHGNSFYAQAGTPQFYAGTGQQPQATLWQPQSRGPPVSMVKSYGYMPGGHFFRPPPNVYPGHTWVPLSGYAPTTVDNDNSPPLRPTANPHVPANDSPEPTWASHFGLQNMEPAMEDGKMWLEPRYPSLAPSSTGSVSQPPDDLRPMAKPSPQDLDILLRTEAMQRNVFAGLTTAEAQLFSLQPAVLRDADEADGHWFKSAFGVPMFDSDVRNWLSIFRTCSWDAVTRKAGPSTESYVWSFMDPQTGPVLKPSVVLADAILKDAIQDRWLQTILQTNKDQVKKETVKRKDGTIQTRCYLPRRGSEELIENPLAAPEAKKKRITEEFDEEDVEFGVDIIQKLWRKELKEEDVPNLKPKWQKRDAKEIARWETEAHLVLNYLATKVIWTFYDHESDPGVIDNDDGRSLFYVKEMGAEMPNGERDWMSVIALNTDMFAPLLDDNASPMGKVLATHTAAIVMLRGVVTVISRWKRVSSQVDSLAFHHEKIADLVSSFENYTFGGKLDFPFRHNRAGPERNGRSMLITGADWPNAGDWVRDHFPETEPWMERLRMMGTSNPQNVKTRWYSYPIPGAWSVNMLKADFWKKSTQEGFTLKFPKHFKAVTQRCSQTWGATNFESKTFPVESVRFGPKGVVSEIFRAKEENPPKPVDLLEDVCRQIEERLKSRREHWHELRKGWYPSALLAWELTPYSMPTSRRMLIRLSRWIRDQSVRSESLAHQLLHKFWLFEKPFANAGPLGWFFVAVAHMFAACLPSRNETAFYPATSQFGRNEMLWSTLKLMAQSRGVPPGYVDDALRAPYLESSITVEAQHGGLDERKRHLRLSRRMGEIYFFTRPYARVLKKRFMASLRNVEHQARDATDEKQWWVCQFELPPYSADLEGVNEDHSANIKHLVNQRVIEVGETGVIIKPQAFHQFATTMGQARERSVAAFGEGEEYAVPLDIWNRDTVADESYVEIQGDGSPSRFWTIGQIADKVSEGKKWVVEPQAYGPFMVVDISRALEAENKGPRALDRMLWKGPLGYHAKDASLRHHFFVDSWRLFDKVGYVLPTVSVEFVNSKDGDDGKPWWISVGTNVFDITNFPWYEFGGEKLATRLKKQFSTLKRELLTEGGDLFRVYPTVLERLLPYRCAKLATLPSAEIEHPELKMFLTKEEVRWNEFPETGMYVIIDENVYDVSEYCEVHPGGQALLCRYGGRDVTKMFYESHHDPKTLLQQPWFQEMLVGRVIPTRSYDQPIREHEEERSGYIWSKRPEDQSPDGRQPCAAKGFKRAGALVRMSAEELMLCDGDDGERWFNEAWVAVYDLVYNMTPVVRYNKESWVNSLKPFLGGVVTDKYIAGHIVKNYAFRAVAQLIDEKTDDEYLLGKRKRGDNPREYALKLQHRDRMLFNDPPVDVYLDGDGNPQSNIPNYDSQREKYPFRTPKRRRPPAPYHDYNTPLDKDTYLKHASGKYYRLLKDLPAKRTDEEKIRRAEEHRHVHWRDVVGRVDSNEDMDDD